MYNNDIQNVESQIIKDVQRNHSLHFNAVGAMDCMYFLLLRSSAKCSVSHTNENLATIPCDQWPMLIELLEPMNSGRLVTFYGYVCYSNISWTAQYVIKFHRKLYALYPTKYPSILWMVKQIIKGMWSDLTYHFNSSHGQCH